MFTGRNLIIKNKDNFLLRAVIKNYFILYLSFLLNELDTFFCKQIYFDIHFLVKYFLEIYFLS